MLRTQEAALYTFGHDGMTALCEAICLDAVEVAAATRVSIWFFDDSGDMICKRLLDSRDGRFTEGAVIPRSATVAYLDAAARGLASMQTDNAPELPSDNPSARDQVQARIDLLLVDSNNSPAAIFRCERCDTAQEWRPRDITVLRNLAQTLATAIRRHSQRYNAEQAIPAVPSVALSAMGSARQNLDWLRRGTEPSIWLQSMTTEAAFDALGLHPPVPGLEPLASDLFTDLDDDDMF
ncbi:hypothetical protein [Ferrovibrio terrae]|jgi:GAF domain-containing protein|uniref:hypothetical protein n=1 Tax=Ferrovibrio terrae TaxID=2594003 RepID=UPI003137D1B0